MQVFLAHQKRVGELRELYNRLLAQELKLFEARSASWRLQERSGSTREAGLEELADSIAGIEMEVEYLQDLLRDFSGRPPTGDSGGIEAPVPATPAAPPVA